MIDFGDAAVLPSDPVEEPRGDRAHGRPGRRGGRDSHHPRRRSLDHGAEREGSASQRTARSRSSTSTRTRTRARRCSASRSPTERRCTGSCATGTSTARATCRSAFAATGRARRSSPGRPSTASRASSCTTSVTVGIRAIVEQTIAIVGDSARVPHRRRRRARSGVRARNGHARAGRDDERRSALGVPGARRRTCEIVGMDVVEVLPTAVASADITALVAERSFARRSTGIAVRRSRAGQVSRARSSHCQISRACTTPVVDAAIGLEVRDSR